MELLPILEANGQSELFTHVPRGGVSMVGKYEELDLRHEVGWLESQEKTILPQDQTSGKCHTVPPPCGQLRPPHVEEFVLLLWLHSSLKSVPCISNIPRDITKAAGDF